MIAQSPARRRRVRRPRPEVEVRVRLVIEQDAAVTLLVAQEDLADMKAVKARAAQAIYDGDLRPEIYHITIDPGLVYRLDAKCKIKDPADATPWCRIHDSPMNRTAEQPACYGRPRDGQPREYGR